ncbi:MAG: hypothetical protein M1824_004963 [Vezdaea acicularis]|nr:MAG: hypothetical protein M1824_004963 [Vezdaea acicularis]
MQVKRLSTKRRRCADSGELAEPTRKSLRLQERQQSNPQVNLKQDCSSREETKEQPKPLRTERIQNLKRRRDIEEGPALSFSAKRHRHIDNRGSKTPNSDHKYSFIQSWLSTPSWSRRFSMSDNVQVSSAQNFRADNVLPSSHTSRPSASLISSQSSRKSDKSAANVRDVDFDKALSYRNIFIESQEPSQEFLQRAKEVLNRQRLSPEIDDVAAERFKTLSNKCRLKAEPIIREMLSPYIVPPLDELSETKLARNIDQSWRNSVPVPLNPSILIDPLPLPTPKPDEAFGYRSDALSADQRRAIDLLVDSTGQSYAMPDDEIRFPFLTIEYKSQAKTGTHHVATNQNANSGSVALHSNLELIRRGTGVASIDYNEPQFFSGSIDHESARINVHWYSYEHKEDLFSFHVRALSKHFLDDAEGLRTVRREIRNILDFGRNERHKTLSDALDAYTQRIRSGRGIANLEDQARNGQLESRNGQQNRPPRMQPLSSQRKKSRSRSRKDLLSGRQLSDDLSKARKPRNEQSLTKQQGSQGSREEVEVMGKELSSMPQVHPQTRRQTKARTRSNLTRASSITRPDTQNQNARVRVTRASKLTSAGEPMQQ